MSESDPLWYKDAVIYELHVKAFHDSTGNGIGDFNGLTQKLDYIHSLGVTALWLLPFYPSPLRDDGYDIADYRNINPAFGTMREFRAFVRAAHDRGLKVITELVINHTSDQHPWFQRARHAKPGSAYRDFFVWSESDRLYADTRIIFTDTEKSNWAWDEAAKAFYWHRFFSHQPDLNFDNPAVIRALLQVMRHWLGMGVDGVRLDAIPYLVEREGTINENLPETHAVIRQFRAALDAEFPGRLFLAEANQWPEDVRPYFGNGDECHMAFHFPLMPRMFMAIAQEDRHPITDIMRQTPEIPEGCQWAIFLRNHDELTLEMVTDRERDYLWSTYASDPRAKLNLGIRRRLAPLLDNDRRKIELLNSLLMSMPGTPILYYGDEIGMGDNFYLGDRDGVRTPMQWSEDRNGGFSHADPARLYLPPIMDPVYGFHAVNVEAQARSPYSLLNWTRRLIAVRQARKVFGRGTLTFLYPSNRKVLAYLRSWGDEVILCVANLARSAQPVELDLSAFKGRVPTELLGRSNFPPIGELPYVVTLGSYGFYWFLLAERAEDMGLQTQTPEIATLVLPEGWSSLLGRARGVLEHEVLPHFLAGQRWFGAKGMRIARVELADWLELESWLVTILRVTLGDGTVQHYLLPLAIAWESGGEDAGGLWPSTLTRVRRGARLGLLHDAFSDGDFVRALLRAVAEGRRMRSAQGAIFAALPTAGFPADLPAVEVRRLGAEQSNSSVLVDQALVLKGYRRLETGIHPEPEMCGFLSEVADYRNTPRMLGSLELVDQSGEPMALAVLSAFVRNQGNAWEHTLHYLERFIEEASLHPATAEAGHESYLTLAATLGRRTAELHRAFALGAGGGPAFDTEAITPADLEGWSTEVVAMAEAGLADLKGQLGRLSEADRADAEKLLALAPSLAQRIRALVPANVDAVKSRLHGDFHLGQVMVVENDLYIIDFEGEPTRVLAERRRKHCPLKDVAGMVRSFDYAAWATLIKLSEDRSGDRATIEPLARRWCQAATEMFLATYHSAIRDCPSWPGEEAAEGLTNLFILEKAFYEIRYELANRPAWVGIPLRGVLRLIDVGEDDRNGGAQP